MVAWKFLVNALADAVPMGRLFTSTQCHVVCDCGAIACSVTKALLTIGIEFGDLGMIKAPTIECVHYGWLRLLNENIESVQCCYHLYQTMPAEQFIVPEDSVVYAMSVGLESVI